MHCTKYSASTEDLSDDEYIISRYSVPHANLSVASILQPGMGKSRRY